MCLQETKWKASSKELVRSMVHNRILDWVHNRFLDWVASDVDGVSGGLVIRWDKRVLELMGTEVSSHTLPCRFNSIANGSHRFSQGCMGQPREVLEKNYGKILGLSVICGKIPGV